MNSEVILQIFCGGFKRKSVSFNAVKEKLNFIFDRMPVNKVIAGWHPEKSLYEKTAAFLSERNIEFYLWFPVFSETGVVRNLEPLIDYNGRRNEKKSGDDEDFSFCCPNNPQNIEKILDIFEKEFSSVNFNGIFLDKIRYPSFANNDDKYFKGVFTCFCPHCLSVYDKNNLDVDKLKSVLSLPLDIIEYSGSGEYIFKNDIVSKYFSVKSDIIYESLKRICEYFRKENYGIGFDVFAPFLSSFTGQNLRKLSGLCDFIKPMMYRAANAPAGLPFETEALLRELSGKAGNRFYKSLGICPSAPYFDLFFTVKELNGLTKSLAVPVYAGVEINRIKDKADVTPSYIEETMTEYSKTGIKGFALSWNMLDAPKENIEKAAETLRKISC